MTRRGRLRRFLPILGLSFVVSGCRRNQPPPLESTLARGDEVVVETQAGEFFEGRVLNVDAQKVKLQTLTGDDLLEVGVGDVYRVPGPKWNKPAAAYGICNTEAHHWEGCQVEHVVGDRLQIATADGVEKDLSSAQVLSPSDVTELNLEQRFELAQARRRFEDQARQAGKPERPSGWRPARHDQVLAHRGDHWISARIERDTDAGAGVLWEDQGRVVTLPKSDVVPLPPYRTSEPLAVGGFALMAPELAGKDWTVVKIESITDADAVVTDGNGKSYRAQLRQLVPLRH